MLPRGYLLLLFKSNVIFDTLNYRLELGAELFYRLQDILIVLPLCNLSLDERFFCVFFPFNLSIYEKQLQVRENRYNPFENLSLAGFKFFMTLLDQSNLLPSCVPFIIAIAPDIGRDYWPMVRRTLFSGRVLLDDSLSW